MELKARYRKAAGFTLLELLVVIAILSSMAYLATDVLTEDDGQRRFDDTKQRLKTLKRAIIGTPERTVNDQPQISGFVADVGRLPRCLQELTERDADCDDDGVQDDHMAAASAFNPDTQSMVGWNGSYLPVMAQTDGQLALRDGWGNPISGTVVKDFGWVVWHDKQGASAAQKSSPVDVNDRDSDDETLISLRRDLHIESFGRDGVGNNTTDGSEPYEDNFPRYDPVNNESDLPFIMGQDHHVDLEGYPVNVTIAVAEGASFPSGLSSEDFCLQLAYPLDGKRVIDDVVYGFNIDTGSNIPDAVAANSQQSVDIEINCPTGDVGDACYGIDPEVLVPWGQRALRFGKLDDLMGSGTDYCTDLNRTDTDYFEEDGVTELPEEDQKEIARTAHSHPFHIIARSVVTLPEITATYVDDYNGEGDAGWIVEFD